MLPILAITRPLRFTRPGRLLPWMGPAVRGLLLWRLKQNVCKHSPAEQLERWRYCTGCEHMTACPYGQTFEPDPPTNAVVFRGQEQTARPVVIRAPFPQREQVRPGDEMPLTLLFIGAGAIGHIDEVWGALAEAGADATRGLGPQQVTFAVGREVGERRPEAIELSLRPDEGGAVEQVSVELTAPLFLRAVEESGRRHHIEQPTFADLLRASLRTLGGLFALYDAPVPAEFLELKRAAESVPMRSGRFRTYQQPRWSNRQQKHRPLYGTVGTGVYGPVPGGLLPWLRWGGRVGGGDGPRCGGRRVAGRCGMRGTLS